MTEQQSSASSMSTTEERERLTDALRRVEALMAELQEGPKAIIEAAKRQAAQITANAEREARNLITPASPGPVASSVRAESTATVSPVPTPPAVEPPPPVVPSPPVTPTLLGLSDSTAATDRPAASSLQPLATEELSEPPPTNREPAWDVEFLHPNPPSMWRKARIGFLAVTCAALLGFLSVRFRDQFAVIPANVQTNSVAAPAAVQMTRNAEVSGEPAEPAAPKSMTLTISAEKTCWIRMAVDGTQPVERTLRPSETLVLHALDSASIRVGDAGAIKLFINSRPARPLGRSGEVVSRLITMENHASYLQ